MQVYQLLTRSNVMHANRQSSVVDTLQAKEAELQAHCKQQQHAFRKVILQREKLDPTQQENLQDPGTAAEVRAIQQV